MTDKQTVEPDSLNRMISCAADDSRIIGICGETKLENERESLTTMIQVGLGVSHTILRKES
jgi:chitin synthase